MLLRRLSPSSLPLRILPSQTSIPFARDARLSRKFATSPGDVSVSGVSEVQGPLDTPSIKTLVWETSAPLVIRNGHDLPAITKWFASGHGERSPAFTEYFRSFEELYMPYEFTTDLSHSKGWNTFLEWMRGHSSVQVPALEDIISSSLSRAQDGPATFHQFQAPLQLLTCASQYNCNAHEDSLLTQLYIAQSDIGELPAELRHDLPVPDLVKNAPKGDIYSSSIWLGLQPTYTPLHRDPNPNIFCQLHGHKTVRFMPNKVALDIYKHIQRILQSGGHASMRGAEMMQGPERDLLHKATWHPEAQDAHHAHISEATVGPGDALYIPKGWWHTFVSRGPVGSINASANWWCR
ncbi:uncharacterized protein B0I36DRAFT_333431 [Microdochium trichocladiopsis]|uniref:JmjC domain-containing protein n=1 Tax=Microdochium trichocladiopsis TaxID=1682393 RepID=A0A9P8XYN0_9PEZI|nr:uncharacterized protein B0I36DRAFT_333431 [Microdochium trichocladiopsis]KAH7020919.1 hypothetical protein B0I36DRAFT_333431 [Microdochium trichocladiopsis]